MRDIIAAQELVLMSELAPSLIHYYGNEAEGDWDPSEHKGDSAEPGQIRLYVKPGPLQTIAATAWTSKPRPPSSRGSTIHWMASAAAAHGGLVIVL